MEKMNTEAKAFYETTLNEARKQIEIIDSKIEAELARAKEVINQLQEQKKATRLIYDGAAAFLGERNEYENGEKSQGN
jgi:hypothetical protein